VHRRANAQFGQVTLDSFNPPMLPMHTILTASYGGRAASGVRTTSRSLRKIQTMNETNLNQVGG
jgi:hypothetical protein